MSESTLSVYRLHSGESSKGGYALKSFKGERVCSTKTRQLTSLGFHFQLFSSTAGCNENVCSFTSIVYSCKRASLMDIEGAIKKKKKKKRKTSCSALTFSCEYVFFRLQFFFLTHLFWLQSQTWLQSNLSHTLTDSEQHPKSQLIVLNIFVMIFD